MGKLVRYFDKIDETKKSPDSKQKFQKNKPKSPDSKQKFQKSKPKPNKVIKKPKDNIKKVKVYLKPKFRNLEQTGDDDNNKSSSAQEEIIKKTLKPNPKPKYRGRAPIDKKLLEKYSRGDGVDGSGVRMNFHQNKLKQKEKVLKFATEQSARAEILLTEQSGLLEADAGETTTQFRQADLVKNLDITSATKHFNLHLNDFGPYRMRYTRNGRHLVLGGRLGHLAAFDWQTKRLHCEFNAMESVHDVCYLHVETMFAAAQKNYVYIYDNQGIELHCLKKLNKVARMQFLPYHFLLATASDEGFLSWLDISIGQMVSQYNTKLGRLSMLCQNPWNAVLCLGHSKGVVSMWSPNMRQPVAKMLCHNAAMTALHVDPRGMYLATSATDRSIKLWDIRKLEGPVQWYRTRACVSDLAFSERQLLAVAMGNVVEVYKDSCLTNTAPTTTSEMKKAYLRHVLNTPITNLMFCPYEDVLGVAHAKGFTSLLVPGSGEPNFDALEVNPYQTKSQRRETEVKSLLEKIQPELITLNPTVISQIDVPTLKDKVEEKRKLIFVKPPKIDFESRKQKKGISSVKAAKTKKILQETAKREFLREMKTVDTSMTITENIDKSIKKQEVELKPKSENVLDRFLPKDKKK